MAAIPLVVKKKKKKKKKKQNKRTVCESKPKPDLTALPHGRETRPWLSSAADTATFILVPGAL